MDSRIKELINKTKARLGLEKYDLRRSDIYREVNSFGETKYVLSLEGFPSHIKVPLEEELNPDGTIIVDVDIHDETWKSIVFVGGKTFATGVTIPSCSVEEIIKWVEAETELSYDKDFYLHKAEANNFTFHACINQVKTFPDGWIDVSLDEEGRLVTFAQHGTFSKKGFVGTEKYTLALDKIEDLAKEQLELVEFPNVDKKRRSFIYAIEENFVTNDDFATISYDINGVEPTRRTVNETIEWDDPIEQAFQGKEIIMDEDITIEQALEKELSPAATRITMKEEVSCIEAVRDLLRQEYKNDSGKWKITTFHRDKGYILATIKKRAKETSIFKRKITVLINGESLTVDNYIDNKFLLESLLEYDAPKEVAVTKEVAYAELRPFIELTPYYVYDFEQECYRLCRKIDSDFGVDAHTGEIISLNDL